MEAANQFMINLSRAQLEAEAQQVQGQRDADVRPLLAGANAYGKDGAVAAVVETAGRRSGQMKAGTIRAVFPISAFAKGRKGRLDPRNRS